MADEPTASAGVSNRHAAGMFAGVGLVAAVGVAIAAMALGGGDGGGGQVPPSQRESTSTTEVDATSSTSTVVEPTPGVADPDAQAMLDLLRVGLTVDSHVRLEAAPENVQGGSVGLEIWRGRAGVRQDEIVAADEVVVESIYLLTDRTVRCVRSGNEPPTCATSPVSETDVESARLRGLLRVDDAVRGRRVLRSPDDIAGEAAQCFSIVDPDPAAIRELCLSRDGIPLRIGAGPLSFEAVLVERIIDPGVLEPPT